MTENLAAVSNASGLIKNISTHIANPIIVVMFTCALFLFLWGVRAYISGADNQEVRMKGANQMLWGIIGMAIMLMTFSIIRIILATFGITSGGEGNPSQIIERVLN